LRVAGVDARGVPLSGQPAQASVPLRESTPIRGVNGDLTLTPAHVTRETRNLNHASNVANQCQLVPTSQKTALALGNGTSVAAWARCNPFGCNRLQRGVRLRIARKRVNFVHDVSRHLWDDPVFRPD
jgi:hypothetical protein